MPDLLVPENRDDVSPDEEFREYYRALIENAVRRSGGATGNQNLRSLAKAAWIVAVGLLFGDLALFGIDYWVTTLIVLNVIVLTVAWFLAAAKDLLPESNDSRE